MSDNPHFFCDRKIAELKHECGGLRIENKRLKLDLECVRASAATADGIAQQVFSAIKAAMGGQSVSKAEKAPMAT